MVVLSSYELEVGVGCVVLASGHILPVVVVTACDGWWLCATVPLVERERAIFQPQGSGSTLNTDRR